MRAIDVIVAQPQWNGEHLAVLGVSQGGFQVLAAAGLDKRVTYFTAGVAAGCDHAAGYAVSPRIVGWPKLLAGLEGAEREAAREASRYFDGCNFASRITCLGLLTVDYIDTACPPSTVYAAYNALAGGPKKMHDDATAGHENAPAMGKEMVDSVREHIASVRV